MHARLIEIFVASLFLGATSLFSRVVVWMPGGMRTRWLPWLEAMAVGLLIGDSLLHLLPHALASHDDLGEIMLAFVIGATFLAIVENVVRFRRVGASAVAPAARMTLAMAIAVPAGALAVAATLPSEKAAALTAAFAGGSILYVALADILPAAWLKANGSARLAPAIGIAAGVVSMWLLARGERA